MSSTAVERAALMERLSVRLGVVGLIPFLLLLVVVVMTLVEPRFYACRIFLTFCARHRSLRSWRAVRCWS
jgi:hypothetical protein